MKKKHAQLDSDDIRALHSVIDLVKEFLEKNIIRRERIDLTGMREEVDSLYGAAGGEDHSQERRFHEILDELVSLVRGELQVPISFIVGGHGGIIIGDRGFCEFDVPTYAIDLLLDRMRLAVRLDMPYNLEVAVCCLEWLHDRHPEKIAEFVRLFKCGRFEILNPTYSQPYALIIGSESTIKQFEYGLRALRELDLQAAVYYSSESSLHPQIPQIAGGFSIRHGSLRSRMLGTEPTAPEAHITWVGLDDTALDAIIDQSGIYNGEYWHGTFYRELPDLLFQAVTRPAMNRILYSSLEDFIMPQPFQEEVWRISRFRELFGRFMLSSEFCATDAPEGEYTFCRDDFSIGDDIFKPGELFLHNKRSEQALLAAEVINAVLKLYDKKGDDALFEGLWKELLLTQAHDCYAVPFIRTGDYSRFQLPPEEFDRLGIEEGTLSLAEMCLQKHEMIQESCDAFIGSALASLGGAASGGSPVSSAPILLVFNPAPRARRDRVSVHLSTEPPASSLLSDGQPVPFRYRNEEVTFIAEVPGFGYRVYTFADAEQKSPRAPSFPYEVAVIDDESAIAVACEGIPLCELRAGSGLRLEEQYRDDMEERDIITGTEEGREFRIEIIRHDGVNRLEFLLDSGPLREIIITPKFRVERSLVNYPFGIEVTKRSNIQALDFLWLQGSDRGLLYVQRNSQKFRINRNTFETRNLFMQEGRFEFSIAAAGADAEPLSFVDAYNCGLRGTALAGRDRFERDCDSFLTIDPPLSVINLWCREGETSLRLFNPNSRSVSFTLQGALVPEKIRVVDLQHRVLSIQDPSGLRIGPWKIMTLALQG
jgi:hypothetical protein